MFIHLSLLSAHCAERCGQTVAIIQEGRATDPVIYSIRWTLAAGQQVMCQAQQAMQAQLQHQQDPASTGPGAVAIRPRGSVQFVGVLAGLVQVAAIVS